MTIKTFCANKVSGSKNGKRLFARKFCRLTHMTDQKKKFVEEAAPEYWYTYARELADTATGIIRGSKSQSIVNIVERANGKTTKIFRSFASRPALLLYGLSLENLLKGLLISENPNLLKDGRLGKCLRTHNLLELSGKQNTIQLNESEVHLLKLLSDSVPYHGRYPVPLKAESIKPEQYIYECIDVDFWALFKRLEMQLYKLNYKGIEAPEGVCFAQLRLSHLDDEADFIADDLGASRDGSRKEFDR